MCGGKKKPPAKVGHFTEGYAELATPEQEHFEGPTPHSSIYTTWLFDRSINSFKHDERKRMPITVMSSAHDYFAEIVEPTVNEFQTTPSTFKTAFAVATALFHAHEWLWQHNRPDLEAHYERTFGSAGKFWEFVESQVGLAGYMRDVANASKHVKIDRRTSTGMSHIANTHIESSSYGTGSYGRGRYSGGNLTMDDSGRSISFDECVGELIGFWRPLLSSLPGNLTPAS